MSEDACNCEDPNLVPVIDRNMSPVYVSGNPYSRYCQGCGRRYFCKDLFWTKANERWVIPKGEDEPIKVEDLDDENYFECPACDHPQFGFPSECDECGEEYNWPDEAGSDD